MSTTAPVVAPPQILSNPVLPRWNQKRLLLKDCAIRAFSFAKERFNTVVDRYKVDVGSISENTDIAAERIQAILLRFLMVLSDEQAPQVKAHLQNEIGEDNFKTGLEDVFTTDELVREAKKLTPRLEMLRSLVQICDVLIAQEHFWDAIEVASPYKEAALRVIDRGAVALVKKRRPVEAVEAAGLHSTHDASDETFSSISDMLTRQEPFEEAALDNSVVVALKIRGEETQCHVLKKAAVVFAQKGLFKKADQTVRLISLDNVRVTAIHEIQSLQEEGSGGCVVH